MRAIWRWTKMASFTMTGCLFVGGSCLPDNFWAGILGTTVIDGVVGGLRNTVLVALGLETP